MDLDKSILTVCLSLVPESKRIYSTTKRYQTTLFPHNDRLSETESRRTTPRRLGHLGPTWFPSLPHPPSTDNSTYTREPIHGTGPSSPPW